MRDVKSDVKLQRNRLRGLRGRAQAQIRMSGSLDRRAPVRMASVRDPRRRRMQEIEMKGRISFNKLIPCPS